MTGRLPNFLIVGAMRSGTTSLTRYLDEHPEVLMCDPKEPHFFDRHFDRGVDWYASLFAGATTQTAVGEATQTYMYEAATPARLAATLPDARLVAILRNPVDRAYSHYWHKRSRGNEPLSFADAVAAEPGRLRPGDPRALYHHSYLDRGRYLAQLRRICEHYPRSSLSVILFEDLRDRPAETYRSVCRFLGVDDSFRPRQLGTSVNRYVTFRSQRLRQVGLGLPAPLRRVVGALNSREASYPPIDPSLRRQLLVRFEEDNAALASWLDRDLSVWRS